MASIEIELRIPQRNVFVGETFPVETFFVNNTADPAPVTDVDEPSPFAFRLVPQQPDKPYYVVSQAKHLQHLVSAPMADPSPGSPLMLDAGFRLGRKEDLAGLHHEGFAVGQYNVDAVCEYQARELCSSPVPVTVKPPSVDCLASHVSVFRQVVNTVFTDRDSDGVRVILQRESLAGRAEFGVFHRRHYLGTNIKSHDLSLAVSAGHIDQGRWLAWLADDTLGALKGWGTQVTTVPEPLPTGLESPQLVQPGFQFEDGAAFFFVTGNSRGRVRLHAYKVSGEGIQLAWDMDFATRPPDLVVANYDPAHGFQLVWSEQAGARRRLFWRFYGTRERPVARDPRLLAELVGDLAAFVLDPVVDDRPAALRCLEESARDGSVIFRRIVLEPSRRSSTTTARHLPAPSAAVDQWAVSSTLEDDWRVLAKAGSNLFSGRAGTPLHWHVVATDVPPLRHLKFYSLGEEQHWAEWIDAVSGLARHPIHLPTDG